MISANWEPNPEAPSQRRDRAWRVLKDWRMRRLSRRRFGVLFAIAASAIASGCLSPTLPLPPPSEPQVGRIDNNHYRLTGALPLPGQVFAQNTRTDLVFGQVAPARVYDFVIEARRGDEITLWYLTGTTVSDYISFQIDADLLRAERQGRHDAAADAGSTPKDGGTDGGDGGLAP